MTKLDASLITPLPASDSCSAAVWDSKRINCRPQSDLEWIPFQTTTTTTMSFITRPIISTIFGSLEAF